MLILFIHLNGKELNNYNNSTYTIAKGNLETSVAQDYPLNTKQSIKIICGNSEIKIKPDEITIQSDKVILDKPGAAQALNIKAINPETAVQLLSGSYVGGESVEVEHIGVVEDDTIKECNMKPTPAPTSIIGKCSYYKWRYDDFVKRHKGCDHKQPPDYYMNYGAEFCKLFSTDLYNKMDNYGKGWVIRTRKNLQVDMEAFLKSNPDSELSNREFYELAFQSHHKAYLDAGFMKLSENDVVQFLDIQQFLITLIDVSDVGTLARNQTYELGKQYFTLHKDSHIDPNIPSTFRDSAAMLSEATSEGGDLSIAWFKSYTKWLYYHELKYLAEFKL